MQIFNLPHLTDGSFTVILYSQAAPTSNLLNSSVISCKYGGICLSKNGVQHTNSQLGN